MATVKIPECLNSLEAYYSNNAVRRAVDDLVGKLDGTGMPDLDWKETQNYNQALLMAAQVRADYVALLFDIWDATFGSQSLDGLGHEYFDHEHLSPNLIWSYQWLWRSYYCDGDPDAGGRHNDLTVTLRKATLNLRVFQYNENGELSDSGVPTLKGVWSTQHDEIEGGPCLANKGVKFADFLSDPDGVVDRFSTDAAKIIQALLET